MSLLFGSSYRRKILFATVAIAAGGYASYRLYNSSAFVKKRRQLLQIMSTMSFFGDAVSGGAESMYMVSTDLKNFLSGDEDTVPQSLRQAFKLWQCQEFQETVTVLSAALTRGLIRGAKLKSGKDGPVRSRWRDDDSTHVKVEKSAFFPVGEDVACREIREVSYTLKNDKEGSNDNLENYSMEYELEGSEWSPVIADDVCNFKTQNVRCLCTAGSGFQDRVHRKNAVQEKKASEDFPDGYVSKLFSERGVGFVSAVAGSVARNFVLAFFDGFSKESSPSKDYNSNDQHEFTNKKTSGSQFLDVISNENCRALIAECIQTFVTTAVTIYIDKTKDMNIYEDMVAGITNPSHKDDMKDVLTSVCNGAVETLVRTSYNALVVEKNEKSQSPGREKWKVEEDSFLSSSGERQYLKSLVKTNELVTQSGSSNWVSSNMESSKELVGNTSYDEKSSGMQTFIDGVTRTLAVPSNQKLLVDMVGKMSSEAVRSLYEAMTKSISFNLKSKACTGWNKVKSRFSGDDGDLALQSRNRRSAEISAKAFIMASICLAICLHISTALLHYPSNNV